MCCGRDEREEVSQMVKRPSKAQIAKALGIKEKHVCLGNYCSCNAAKAAAKRSELVPAEKTF